MGACTLCHESGHNKRTCSKQQIHPGTGMQDHVITSVPKKTFSTSSKPLQNPAPEKPPASLSKYSVLKQQLGIPENVRYLQPAKTSHHYHVDHTKTVIPPACSTPNENPKISEISKKLKNQEGFQTVLNLKGEELERKLKNLPSTPDERKVETVSNGCKACDKLLGTTGYWLSSTARQRLIKGPTEKDGPGFIYIYTYLKPHSEEEQFLYKIGMSEKADGKRRIQVQERKNKEEYKVVFHEETPFRYLSETVVHLELKDVRSPRDLGDGRTEWFKGTAPAFTRLVKDVIKEVRFGELNGIWSEASENKCIESQQEQRVSVID